MHGEMRYVLKLQTRMGALVAGVVATGLAFGGTAAAAHPDFSGCPSTSEFCVDIQSTSGTMDIKGFGVPLHDSLRIRGGLATVNGQPGFFPARGTSGFIARPVQVPGGILGISFPLPGNAVTATAKLAGSTSQVRINPLTLDIALPLKLELTNPLIGPGCQIGSNSNPVWVRLITGTTNPPAPNRPISGRIGTLTFTDHIRWTGSSNVDNSFAIPGASGCGLGLGLINGAINLKLRLPSAAGNNALIVNNDVGLSVPPA